MARFEQVISEDDVAAARQKIAAGASLRSAAAEIPCAPSTLSVRIKKAEAAEDDARGAAAIGEGEDLAAQGSLEHPDAHGAPGESALAGDIGPIEILRGAFLATKANGLPDWPTRISAARTLAALRPEELEPKEQPAEPSITVYDLPPGTAPVLHRASEEAEAPVSQVDAPSKELPRDSVHMFFYEPLDGERVLIGMWSSPDRGKSVVSLVPHHTDESETAARWRAELSAGSLPVSAENEP